MDTSEFSIIVFDFDGTLVDSNRGKRDAFFDIFPQTEEWRRAVRDVLESHLEESRFVILREIIQRQVSRGMSEPAGGREAEIERLADAYGARVLEVAISCPEIPGAGNLLRRLSESHRLYLSSTTPEVALLQIVAARGWTSYFEGISGFPKTKPETLAQIVATEDVRPEKVLGVGDGSSDQRAAEGAGIRFFKIAGDDPLRELLVS